MTSELKPCPFCGGDAEITEYHTGNFEVQCSNETCGVQPNSVLDNKETVINDWNTRAVPDVPELVRYSAIELVRSNDAGYDPLPSDDGDYVEFSQAAEIIAAKNAEIERLKQREIMIVSHATMGGTDGQGVSINDISVRITDLRNGLYNEGVKRAETAEAKLAQIKAQAGGAVELRRYNGEGIYLAIDCGFDPIPYADGEYVLYADVLPILTAKDAVIASITREGLKDLGDQIKSVGAQAKPAPSADLKTENERHKQALEFYADKANWESGDFQHSVDEHLGHNVLTLNMPHAINDQGKIARAALNVEASNDKG